MVTDMTLQAAMHQMVWHPELYVPEYGTICSREYAQADCCCMGRISYALWAFETLLDARHCLNVLKLSASNNMLAPSIVLSIQNVTRYCMVVSAAVYGVLSVC